MKVGKKELSQKILISILTLLMLFNFIFPTVVRADDDDYDGEASSLAGPIQSLIVLIGDAGMSLMQYVFVGNWDITKRVKEEEAVQDLVEKVVAILVPGGITAVNITNFFRENKYIDIPNFQISPESIFQGKIPAFDINFFNPMSANNDSGTWEESDKVTVETSEEENAYKSILQEYGWTKDESVSGTIVDGWNHPNQTEEPYYVNSTNSLELKFNWIEENSQQKTKYTLVYKIHYENARYYCV